MSRSLPGFLALGLFWGVSPSLYKQLSLVGMPVSHTVVLSGFGVGLLLYLASGLWRGNWGFGWRVMRYGVICAALMNGPFALNLFLASRVPPTEMAVLIASSPFFNYIVALVTGWEVATPRRLLAIAVGFCSTLVLILSREGMFSGEVSIWLVVAVGLPLIYSAYNNYAARAWPAGADMLQVGAAESIASGLIALPFLLWMAPFGAADGPALVSYAFIGAAVAMWVIERISYFTLIRSRGALYTVQATYVSTPAAVVIAGLAFGGVTDQWLWLSLALLMVALWLNNSGAIPAQAQPAQ